MAGKLKRFCSKGHDKFLSHGMYIFVNKNGKIQQKCAICRREYSKKWYLKHKNAKNT